MTIASKITVLVSCPDDVKKEKDEIISICSSLSKSYEGTSDVQIIVKDWRDYVGKYGKRPQEQLITFFGDYDLYIGILWKRFGSVTGSINPSTQQEYESGTEEEFYDAIQRWQLEGKPEIYFFIKTFERNVNNEQENKQIGSVFKFISEQVKSHNNFLNEFDSPESFRAKIIFLISSKHESLIFNKNIKEKEVALTEVANTKSYLLQSSIPPTQKEYIKRNITHFSLIKDKHNIPFLEIEIQSLEQLVLSKYRVVLLGDAGSGKSTELINLLHGLNSKDSSLIPIFQSLNTYTPEKGIEEFLPDFWKRIPPNLLLIIWDGLDEILPEHFYIAIRQISNFTLKFPETRIVISCRTNFYELPVNGSPGTLVGFEPYFINDLTFNDVRNFYVKKCLTSSADDFIEGLIENSLTDLIVKPFFLMLLVDDFSHGKKLSINRSELYEKFVLNRIRLDEVHFINLFDIRGKKNEIMLLLEKVALSMEILTRNQILESEILQLITLDEFSALKHCTAFKKKDGEDATWQFEHNNLQEYLAARALVNYDFEKVIKFLTFERFNNKLIPSWVNTLTFLFSLLNKDDTLFIKLLEWMLKNEKELVVKFEPDKVPDYLRDEIFKGIFNYYKKLGVWISSNKFNERELGKFGQSESNIRFLLSEIRLLSNSKIVKLNAIRLLGNFELSETNTKREVEKLLLEIIESYKDDPNFIGATINAMRLAGITNKNAITQLLQIVGNRKSQYIRSAVYAILLISNNLEENIGYLIEGLGLYLKPNSPDRDDTTFIDEGWHLKQCFLNVKSPSSLNILISYFSDNKQFDYWFDTDKVLKAIIDNAVEAYISDKSIYDSILKWFVSETRGHNQVKSNIIITFFDKTNTRKRAFHQIWDSLDDTENTKKLSIAKLITGDQMLYIIDQYHKHNITNQQLENIYFNMCWVRNDEVETFEKLLNERTDFKFKTPPQIDYDAIRQRKVKEDFDLLFNVDDFRKETLRIFDAQGKEDLSFDELNGIRKENNRYIELDDYYSGVSLRLIRDFVQQGESVSKKSIILWFENAHNEIWYRISIIYEHLSNYKFLVMNEKQKEWIKEWCIENISKINFKDSIEINDNGVITYKTMSIYLWHFSRSLNIDYPEEIFLDMLSFDFYENNSWVGIDYLSGRLNQEKIIIRMLHNLRQGIADNQVLENHIKFLSQKKVKESYELILNEIVNTERADFHRKEYLTIFFEGTKDITSLKKILIFADPTIKWLIIDKLKCNGEELFVENYLLNDLTKGISDEEKGKTAEVLVTLQNLYGLKIYVEWIKASSVDDLEIHRAHCLNNLKKIEALPDLIDLLELSYIRDLKVDRFDRFNSIVIGSIIKLALLSEDNLLQVKDSLGKFMIDKMGIHENVKFLIQTIEIMEDQFYMNRVQVYTIGEVKEKLKILKD
jgi:hypothetical protein